MELNSRVRTEGLKKNLFCLLLFLAFGRVNLVSAGYQFLTDVRVNNDAPGVNYHYTGFTNGHCIGLMGRNPIIVWAGGPQGGGQDHIFVSRSQDGGLTFLPPVRVDTQLVVAKSMYPTLLVDSTLGVCVAWSDSSPDGWRLYFARSTDGGASFGARVRVDSAGGYDAQLPCMVSDPSAVYCVFVARRTSQPSELHCNVYLAKSLDGGASFARAVVVDSGFYASAPTIAEALNGDLSVAWRDDRTDTVNHYPFHVYSTRSTDGGVTFSPAVRVDTPGMVSGTFPCIATDSSGRNVWVAHKQRNATGNYDIFVAHSTDGGQTFVTGLRLDTTDSDVPNLTLSTSGRLLCAWHDSRLGGFGDVYFSYSTDGGNVFTPGQRVNTPETSGVLDPNIAVSTGDTAFVCWTDRRSGQFTPDIYFARGVPLPEGCSEASGLGWRSPVAVSCRVPGGTQALFAVAPANALIKTLAVYDAAGRRMWSTRRPGNSVIWDLTSRNGIPVAPGVYFYYWTADSPDKPCAGSGRFNVVR
jgi:hypothetical protein